MSQKRKTSRKGGGYTVGKYKPPKEHQIKPGEVRNRWGRGGKPKPRQIELFVEQPSQRMLLEEGIRRVRVRTGESTEELPTIQVVLRSLAADAMKPGNILAKRAYIHLHAEAERAEAAARRPILEFWRDHISEGRAQIEQAKAEGKPEPRILPHPDDVVLDYTHLRVRIVGPADEAEAERIDRIIRLKALLYETAVFDMPDVENDPDAPIGQRWIGFWMLHYAMMEGFLPPRLRGVPEGLHQSVFARAMWPRRKWRAHLEDRFKEEGLPFFMIGHCKAAIVRLDDLAEQTGYTGQWPDYTRVEDDPYC